MYHSIFDWYTTSDIPSFSNMSSRIPFYYRESQLILSILGYAFLMRFVKNHTRFIPQDLSAVKQHKATISLCNMICNVIRLFFLAPCLNDFVNYLLDPEAIDFMSSTEWRHAMMEVVPCMLLGSYLVDLLTHPKLDMSTLIHHSTALVAWMTICEGSLPKEFGIVFLLAVCVNQHVQYSIYCYTTSPTSYHTSLVLRMTCYGYVIVEMIAHCTNAILYLKLFPVMSPVAQNLLPVISLILLVSQIQDVSIMHHLSKKIHQIVASDQHVATKNKIINH